LPVHNADFGSQFDFDFKIPKKWISCLSELKNSVLVRFHPACPAGQLSFKNTQDLTSRHAANSQRFMVKRKASISSEPETIKILRAKLTKAEGKKAKKSRASQSVGRKQSQQWMTAGLTKRILTRPL